MKVRLDRTLCDGFGVCAAHAPKHISLDDWGYAALTGNGDVPPEDQDGMYRALLDCPANAITVLSDPYPLQPGPTDSITRDFSGLLKGAGAASINPLADEDVPSPSEFDPVAE